ncbi:hypothetical protein LXA62_18140 [Erwinia amylovora]|nr:hypothetical protein [Erwinia amylovora]
MVITAPVTANILQGFNRDTVITLASDFLCLEVIERDIFA